jgi:hypothetical protein
MKLIAFVILSIVLFVSCNNTKNYDDTALARAGESYLYTSDLEEYLKGVSVDDSLVLTELLVEEWIKKQILLKKAQEQLLNLSEIDQKTKEYKESLLLAEYRSALLKKYDVGISENEIDQYYISHVENFLCPETYFNIQYVLLPKETPNMKDLINILNQDSMPLYLSSYCESNKENCFFSEDTWVNNSKLANEILLPVYHHYEGNQFKVYETEDEYLLIYKIIEKRNKGEVMPLVLVKPQIVQILTYKKKKEKLQEIEDKAFINAINSKSFEIY